MGVASLHGASLCDCVCCSLPVSKHPLRALHSSPLLGIVASRPPMMEPSRAATASPPRREEHASAALGVQAASSEAVSSVAAAAALEQCAPTLSLSPFASTANRVGLAPMAPLGATIAPPSYRTPLPPRPAFQLLPWRRRDMGGARRAAEIEGEYAAQAHVSIKTVLPAEANLTLAQRLRYAQLLIHPIRALKSRHLRALLLYFLLLLPLLVALFALTALLSCSTSALDLVAPLCAIWATASGVGLYTLYLGGAGPFDCGLLEEERVGNGTTVQVHRWLPARFPAAIGVTLTIVCVQALMFALLASGEFSTLCQLRDTISVNEAASYSSLIMHADDSYSATPRTDGSPTLRVNDGTARSDSSSTRQFLAFRDGFVETGFVRGLNLSGWSGASGSSSEPPSRMLLLAPIWAASSAGRDPFYGRLVPAWACGSFSWLDDTQEQRQSQQLLVDSWTTLWRFGRTINSLDTDYANCQGIGTREHGAAESTGVAPRSIADVVCWVV